MIIVTASVQKFGFETLDSYLGLQTSDSGLQTQACKFLIFTTKICVMIFYYSRFRTKMSVMQESPDKTSSRF